MNTLARHHCKAEILRRLRNVHPDSARRWGQMSAHQMICHLCDSCRMAMGDTPVTAANVPIPRPLIRWIALYLPMRWRPGIVTTPEIDQFVGGTPPADFAADVAELETLLENMASRPNGSRWPTHPVFGTMSHRAWMRWAYLHTDHHLRQFGA
jgi:hypothetical protein